MKLTQEQVHDLFEYHQDGYLIWSAPPRVGQVAGLRPNSIGYYYVRIDGTKYPLHRVIFLWHHGYLPTFVDHADRDTHNNRVENLRPATKSQQNQNRLSKPGPSGFRGVSSGRGGTWRAYICADGQRQDLAGFTCRYDAATAYNFLAAEMHGAFAIYNEPRGPAFGLFSEAM